MLQSKTTQMSKTTCPHEEVQGLPKSKTKQMSKTTCHHEEVKGL
jgi:hypothetical protein